jgi:hypothetical protein
VQLFFRGKAGIARLRTLMERRDRLIGPPLAAASIAVYTFERIEQLRTTKDELENRRPLLSTDEDLERAITAVARQIARLRSALDDVTANSKT